MSYVTQPWWVFVAKYTTQMPSYQTITALNKTALEKEDPDDACVHLQFILSEVLATVRQRTKTFVSLLLIPSYTFTFIYFYLLLAVPGHALLWPFPVTD
jgi:hypothetical protein